MKKLFFYLLIGMFMISFVSSAEWDNCKEYNADTKTVKIKNLCPLGIDWFADEMANITLNSELKTIVPAGDDVLVAEVTVCGKDEFKDMYKGYDTYDIKNKMAKKDKNIIMRQKVVTFEEVPIYETVCEYVIDAVQNSKNGTTTYHQECEQVQSGTENKDVVSWSDINQKDIKEGCIDIGLFTDVQAGDYIEWIPNYFGIEVEEWASFQQSTAVDLEAYYRLDNLDGTFVLDDTIQGQNGYTNGDNSTGKIGSGVNLQEANSDYLEFPSNFRGSDSVGTFSFWWYSDTNACSNSATLFSLSTTETASNMVRMFPASDCHFNIQQYLPNNNVVSNISLSNNTWYHIVLQSDGSDWYLYVNGQLSSLTGSNVGAWMDDITGTSDNIGFGRVYFLSGWNYADAHVDEAGYWSRVITSTEIEELYNSGAGLQNPRTDYYWESLDLDTGNILYYKLDETSGTTAIDELETYNGTNNGATVNTAGKINTAYDFEATESDYISTSLTTSLTTFTVSTWVKLESVSSYFIIGKDSEVGNRGWGLGTNTNGTAYYPYFEANGVVGVLSDNPLSAGTWYHLAVTGEDGKQMLYFNGINVVNNTLTINSNADSISIGRRNYGGAEAYFDGLIDEVGIWDTVLNSTQIQGLYNYTSALVYGSSGVTPDASPTITGYNSSANYTATGDYDFSYYASDDIELSNVSVYVNDVLNQTNTDGTNNTDYTFTIPFGDGTYEILGSATDNASQTTNTSAITIIIDSTAPAVDLIYPTATNYTALQTELNFSASDTYLDTCWYSTNATVNITLDNCTSNVTGLVSNQGENIWTIYANDTFGNENSSSVTFYVDTASPELELIYPTAANYTAVQTELNFTVSDDNLEACWYNIGGANITHSCLSNITGLDSGQGESTWTIYANDTFGNENSSSVTFNVDTIAPTITLVSPANESTYNSSWENISIEFTASDANIDSCWYNIGGDNISTTCNDSISYLVLDNENLITYYANDTFGNDANAVLTISGGLFVVNISNSTYGIELINGSSYWEENANLTFNSSSPSTSWFNWLVDGVSQLAGWGENVLTYLFDLPSESPNATVTLNTSSTCYQESANIYNQTGIDGDCGLDYSGTYATIAPVLGTPSPGYFYINYTKPIGAIINGSLWKVKYSDNLTLLEIPSGCWDTNETILSFKFELLRDTVFNIQKFAGSCLNGTTWSLLTENLSAELPSADLGGPLINTALTDGDWDTYATGYRYSLGTGWTQNTNAVDSRLYEEAMLWTIPDISTEFLIVTNSVNPSLTASINTSTIYNVGDKILLNTTATDANVDTCWYNYNSINTTIAGCVSGTQNQTEITTVAGQTDITVYVNDSVGNINSTVLSFVYDTSAPSITITAPAGTANSQIIGDNETLEYSISDDNLNSCWYNYNGTNVSINCSESSTSFLYIEDNNNLTVYANDTIGNENSETTTWDYNLVFVSQSYESPMYETSSSAFSTNVSYTSSDWTSTVGYLIYDDDYYVATYTGSVDDFVFSRDIIAPAVSNDTNITFYWLIQLTNSTGTYNFTSNELNQTVSKVSFELCNLSANPQIVFNTYSTLSPTEKVNATFASAWIIKDADGESEVLTRSFEDLNENVSTWAFCIGPNTTTYTVSADVTVDAANYTPTTHFIVDTDYSGEQNNVSLFLLHDDDSTLTQIVTTDLDNAPVQDVYTYIQRYDLGTDTYYTVGITRSDSAGEDLVYLSWYDDWYKFIGVYDGEVVFTDGPKKISSSPQTFKFGDLETLHYQLFDDILYSLTYNNITQNFILTYVDPSGFTTSNCLRVVKRNAMEDLIICDTCEDSSSATIYCNIAGAGNGTFVADYYSTGSPRNFIDFIVESINVQTKIYDLIGNDNGTGMAIIVAGIVLALFLITPAMGIMGAIFGVLLGMFLGFQPFDYLAMGGLIVVGIAMMWAVQK